MTLKTDAVDFDPASFETCDYGLGGSCFGAGVFDVVIVVVEFYAGVVLSCGLEGYGDVFWTNLSGRS